MVSGLYESGWFVRLGAAEAAEALALHGAAPFEPMPGRPMTGCHSCRRPSSTTTRRSPLGQAGDRLRRDAAEGERRVEGQAAGLTRSLRDPAARSLSIRRCSVRRPDERRSISRRQRGPHGHAHVIHVEVTGGTARHSVVLQRHLRLDARRTTPVATACTGRPTVRGSPGASAPRRTAAPGTSRSTSTRMIGRHAPSCRGGRRPGADAADRGVAPETNRPVRRPEVTSSGLM
jgi:hypothetical protein